MKTLALQLCLFSVLASAMTGPAHAWDGHGLLTRRALLGFQKQNPQLWQKLQTTLAVTPLESLLTRAFGESCGYGVAKDAVFEGYGKFYEVLYTEKVNYRYELGWDKGYSRQVNEPFPADATKNSQALGRVVTVESIFATYADEPDWGADDDVAQLLGKGVSQAGAGTATRMLRHFWYEGESHFGIDFGKDQETDRRAQLFYRLALIAFAVDEPYWGYRFLANALHYVQDMTQVFHAKAVLTSKMTDAYALIHAELCRAQIALGHAGDPIPPRCARPEDQLDAAVIKNGWIVGAYHALYEDYVRGMVENYSKAGSAWLSDVDGYFEKQIPAGQLTWRSKSEDTAMGELLDMRQAIRTARKSMLRFSQAVGDSAYEAFGFNIRYHPNIARQALIEAGTPHSLGYRMGRMGYYQEGVDLTYRQQKGEHALAEVTRNVLIHLGVWTREFLSFSLESASSASGRVESERLRQQFRLQCEQGSRKP